MAKARQHHVVIVGGGFGGLYAAKALKHVPVKVTLVDKRNFHLFQPLLYQVATGGLSPGDITSPLRSVVKSQKHVTTLQAEVVDILPEQRKLIFRDGEVGYDTLIVATGASHHYFGNDQWAKHAPGLKTIEDALDIRRRILLAFERAERETGYGGAEAAERKTLEALRSADETRRALLTFVVVGAGPTGVELAGALAELARSTLKHEFRNIDPTQAEVLLVEGTDRVLPPYVPMLSKKAETSLAKLGVTVYTNARVTAIEGDTLTMARNEKTETVRAGTVLWAAGMKASVLGEVLSKRAGVGLDGTGRVMVQPDLSLPNHPDILVIGDLANFSHQGDKPLPGVAPVAMQQGKYAARLIAARLRGKEVPPFRYWNRGSMAVIGRNAAVADLGFMRFGGFFAWIAWIFVHIGYLIGFDNRLIVMFQWAWNYFTRKRGARLITGADVFPMVEAKVDEGAS